MSSNQSVCDSNRRGGSHGGEVLRVDGHEIEQPLAFVPVGHLAFFGVGNVQAGFLYDLVVPAVEPDQHIAHAGGAPSAADLGGVPGAFQRQSGRPIQAIGHDLCSAGQILDLDVQVQAVERHMAPSSGWALASQ